MGFRDRLKNRRIVKWLRNRRVVQWAKLKLGFVDLPPLRGFVYLDENAVISLLASTTGGITDQQSTRKRKRISGSITSMIPGAKGNIGTSREKSSEVVRRYVIQSNFTEFYGLRKEDLKLSDNADANEGVTLPAQHELKATIDGIEMAEEGLERGDLMELNVELGSHDVFKIYKAIDLFSQIVESLPAGSAPISELESGDFSIDDMDSLIELVDKFLIGLVPIVGKVQNYGLVHDDEKAYVAQKDLLDNEEIEYDSFSIVGFVDEEKLWQDSTRFLFDKREYTAYCRLNNNRFKDDWIPLKLMNVVDSVSEGTSESVQKLPELFNLDSETTPERSVDEGQDLVRNDVVQYLKRIPEDIDDGTIDEIAAEIAETVNEPSLDTEKRESLLEESERLIQERDITLDIADITRARAIGAVIAENTDNTETNYTDSESDWFLEVDFISIYW